MKLSELRAALRTRIGNPSSADVSDSSLTRYINEAYKEIFNKYAFRQRKQLGRFTTVAGVDKYDLSGITDVVYKAWDCTNGRELEYVGVNALAESDYVTTLAAKPERWAFLNDGYIQLMPPPDGRYVIEIVYKAMPASLAADDDSPILPVAWHRGIVILAAHMYYDDEGGDPTKATYHLARFRDWVSNQPLETHEQTEALDSGVEVPTLGRLRSTNRRPDGVWWDSTP